MIALRVILFVIEDEYFCNPFESGHTAWQLTEISAGADRNKYDRRHLL